VTILAGFSASRQAPAPLNLAVQLARTTHEKIVAAAVLENPSVVGVDQIEREYQRHLTAQTMRSLQHVIGEMRSDLDISPVIHQSSSVPRGLMELTSRHDADIVVVGSSSSGLLGRIALGSVTERLVHTAEVAVAIAPRGYPQTPLPVERLTVAYGGAAGTAKLIQTVADLAAQWQVQLRIASFTVRPALMFGGSIESAAEDLVTKQWIHKTDEAVRRQLDEARESVSIPDVDLVIGAGTDWPNAVNDIAWKSGDLLVLGSGAAGTRTQVFLGTAASRILRHVPVPVMIVPRRLT
jgi:nucleotide-binding universal stress UspA family protein